MELTRDLTGYGANRPDPKWPGGARLAFNIILAYEEGGESTLCNGDCQGEGYLMETLSFAAPPPGQRLLYAESQYEYGSRAGVWRLMRLLTERSLTATVLAVGRAVELNPLPIKAMAQAGFEIASHQYRYISYQTAAEEVEREHLRRTISVIEAATGKRPVGIFHWSGPHSRRLAAEEGGFWYDTADYSDDLPFWVRVGEKPLLVIPYMLDNNDFRYSHLSGFSTGKDFFDYNKATFDQLYQEGEHTPGMMNVTLHPRLSGHPGRARAAAQFLDYVLTHKDVWICTRAQIAEHWRKLYPAP